MDPRPSRHEYYLGLAIGAAARAECAGHHVGAVLVRGNRVLSTGYNGAPEGMGNCSDRGTCPRCDHREQYGSGNGYDRCICVHAEMNAIAAAARYGIAIDGATAYVTHQPCFTCAKELIQAGVKSAYYMIELPVNGDDTIKTTDSKKRFVALTQTEQRLLGLLHAVRINPQDVISPLQATIDAFAIAALPKGPEVADNERVTA